MGVQLNPFQPGFNLDPFGSNQAQAPDPSQTPGGMAYNAGQPVAGVGGTESQGQSQLGGMLGTMAAGGGPNPANAALQQATQQGQAMAQAQAGSARGNMGMAGAQHAAMQTGANIGQEAAQQGSVNVQNQQFQAIQMQMQQQQMQRAQDLMAQGMNSQQAMAQAALEASASAQNAKTNTGMFGTLLNAAGQVGQLGEGLLPNGQPNQGGGMAAGG